MRDASWLTRGSNNYNNNKQLSQLSFIPQFLTILVLDSAFSRIMMRLYRSRAVHLLALYDSGISRIMMRR